MVPNLKNVLVPESEATKFLHTELITICVGEEPHQKTFQAHKGLLCERSPFFRAALQGEWVEAKNKTVNLPEDDPGGFEAWLQIAYRGCLGVGKDESHDPSWMAMGKAFVMAEKLLDTTTKNVLIQSVIAHTREPRGCAYLYPDEVMIRTVYEGTPVNSPMHRLLVDLWAQHSYTGWYASPLDDIPQEFLLNVCEKIHLSKYWNRSTILPEENTKTCAPDKYLEKVPDKDTEEGGKIALQSSANNASCIQN